MRRRPGYVYILTNPAMPGLVKVGRTDRSPAERAKRLSRFTGVPAPYKVEHEFFVGNSARAEILAHRALSKYRTTHDREFFQLSVVRAREILEEALLDQLATAPAPASTQHPPSPAVELITFTGPCPGCRVAVSFTEARPDAKQFCVNGHTVELAVLLGRAKEPSTSTQTARQQPPRSSSLEQRYCGICRRELVLHRTERGSALRCPDNRCYARFPRSYAVVSPSK